MSTRVLKKTGRTLEAYRLGDRFGRGEPTEPFRMESHKMLSLHKSTREAKMILAEEFAAFSCFQHVSGLHADGDVSLLANNHQDKLAQRLIDSFA